jgi:hypothetical protein
MSNGYRAKWRDDSTREAEVGHFQRLQVAERFLNLVVKEATAWAEEKMAALDAGMDPLEVLCGSKMYEKMKADAAKEEAQTAPEPAPASAAEKAPETPTPAPDPSTASTSSGQAGSGQAKPKRKQPYRARIYAPQMLALGARAATLLLDLSPLIMAQWKRLVEAGTDPRRLALDDHDGKIAALLFDEIGVQYHEVIATDQEKLREALDKMEAWVKELKAEERKRGAADALPEGGEVAVPSNVEGAAIAEPSATLLEEAKGSASTGSGQAGTFPETASEKEPDPTRPPAPYSAGGVSLDWTKL